MKRFLCYELKDGYALIRDSEHNHLKNVLRLNIGDKIECVGLDEFVYLCQIQKIEKSQTYALVLEKQVCLSNPKVNLTVFQALVKNDNMSLIVQKLSELGVTSLVPFESEFITSKDSKNKQGKLQEIANQSIKQCRRSIPLKVQKTLSFDEMINSLKPFDKIIFANEKETSKSLNDTLKELKETDNVAIIIGSEGGFSDKEISAISKRTNAISISLGSRILRAETASIFLTGLVLYELKEYI